VISLELFKRRLRNYLGNEILQAALDLNRSHLMIYGHVSYSQCGQDIFLSEVFVKHLEAQRKGFYVDIGACHPVHNSNTYFFYRRGWNGICIEPSDVGSLFHRKRPRDTFVHAGASAERGELIFHQFSSPYYNSFDPQSVARGEHDGIKLIRQIAVPTIPLAEILQRHRPKGNIDLMCIDVEGHELSVLSGNNWEKFRPTIICIEMIAADMLSLAATTVGQFLANVGYHPFAKVQDDVFFRVTD
jgi:FkbM family methyltransferase